MTTRAAAYSETSAWKSVRAVAETLLKVWPDDGHLHSVRLLRKDLRDLVTLADTMQEQVEQGIHENRPRRNPVLVTFGNPGSGRIQAGEGETLAVYLNKLLGFVETLEYARVRAPKGYYFHDFGPSDSLWTATLADGQQVVLLANVNGRPLWGKR